MDGWAGGGGVVPVFPICWGSGSSPVIAPTDKLPLPHPSPGPLVRAGGCMLQRFFLPLVDSFIHSTNNVLSMYCVPTRLGAGVMITQ